MVISLPSVDLEPSKADLKTTGRFMGDWTDGLSTKHDDFLGGSDQRLVYCQWIQNQLGCKVHSFCLGMLTKHHAITVLCIFIIGSSNCMNFYLAGNPWIWVVESYDSSVKALCHGVFCHVCHVWGQTWMPMTCSSNWCFWPGLVVHLLTLC